MSDQQHRNATPHASMEVSETTQLSAPDANLMEMQQDKVVRFLFDNHGVRGEIVHLKESVTTLLANLKNYPAPLQELMLELAAAAVLIAATIKTNGTVTVQIQGGQGNKAINFAFINIDKNLNFYGNASWNDNKAALAKTATADNPITFTDLMGKDAILVISVFPENGVRYQGIVSLDKSTLSRCLEEYFKDSEQLPTIIQLHYDLATAQCGGIMLQIIPEIENNIESLNHLSTLSATLTANELFSLGTHECLRRLYWNDQVRVFTPQLVEFKCVCSKERILNAIRGLPLEDLEELSQEADGIDMNCHSCGKSYHVNVDELKAIYNEVRAEQEKNGSPDGSARVTTGTSVYQALQERKGK